VRILSTILAVSCLIASTALWAQSAAYPNRPVRMIAVEIIGSSPAEFTSKIRNESATWAKVIKTARIKVR
jgi:tripartite-type tricarboxylate transporter receptor subunit TctC